MQGFFASWAVAVTIAVVFSVLVSTLLPETGIKKYVSVVLGIVVTIFLLSPLFKLFSSADIEKELNGALKNIDQNSNYEYNSSSYRDYIFKVYMGDK